MTPEAKARETIDRKLALAGWVLQDVKQINLGVAAGVVVREYPTDSGPADYVLFVDRVPVGVIEAKPDDTILLFVEDQTERYAVSALKWRVKSAPLPFLYQSTGQVTRFTDSRDPAPRSREVFHFFRPEELAKLLSQPDTLRRRLAQSMPALPERNLRNCQVSAVTGLEKSLACHPLGRRRREGPANFGVRYLHGGRDLYAACSTPQDGAGRTITHFGHCLRSISKTRLNVRLR